MSKWILILGLAAAPAWTAEDGGIAGPVSGFVADGHGSFLRAIEGLPGAARLGARVRLPFAVAAAAVAFREDYALTIPAGDHSRPVLIRGLRSENPAATPLDVIDASSMILAGPAGTAILYSRSLQRLQFLTGLPADPRVLDPIDSGEVAAMALDASGATAIVAAADGRIYALPSRAPSTLRPIARLNGVSAVSLMPGRDAAVAASSETGDLIIIEGLSGAVSIRTLAAAGAGVVSPRSVAALDSQTVGVIAGDGRLAAIDVNTGAVEWIPLAGAAESFEALDPGLFALNRPGAHPLLLLDALHGRSAWFVPPDRKPATQRGPAKTQIGGEDRPY